jgi:meckelin
VLKILFFVISDSGHSFDAVLLYGHEFSLIIFDIMVFSFVDLFAQDFLLAAIVTYFVGKVNIVLKWTKSA